MKPAHQTHPRPTDKEIDKMVESFLVPVKFHLSLTHTMNKLLIRDWSQGKELKTRNQYCPGWTNEDCKELLHRLEKKENVYEHFNSKTAMKIDPKKYYYEQFRDQFDEWVKKTDAHEHPGEGTFIPSANISSDKLSHIPKDERGYFLCALACTVLIDQVMYSHFKKDYPTFQKMTQYPKLEAGITGYHVHPWTIIQDHIKYEMLHNFIEFFVKDLKEFFLQNQFDEATWETVREAMLADPDVTKGLAGTTIREALLAAE